MSKKYKPWCNRRNFKIHLLPGYQEGKEIFGHIYKTTFPNRKVYIGQTERVINSRKEKDYFGSGVKFWKAVKKYPFHRLKKVILRICYDVEEYNRWEEKYIWLFKADQDDFGYNILKGSANKHNCFGGMNPMNRKEVTEKMIKSKKENRGKPKKEKLKKEKIKSKPESIEKMKKSKKLFYESKAGIAERKRQSERGKKLVGDKNPFYKHTQTDKNKKASSLAHKGKKRLKESIEKGKETKKRNNKPVSDKERKRRSDRMKGNQLTKGLKKSEESKKITKEKRKYQPPPVSPGSKCYNNGIKSVVVKKGDKPPKGFIFKGRLRKEK
jgi:hypothetical protein